jgi:hypothetical protein
MLDHHETSLELLKLAANITLHGKTQAQTQDNFYSALVYINGLYTRMRPAATGTNPLSADGTQIICLDCGKALSSLRRHLRDTHRTTADAYRAKHQLSPTETLVHPDYSARRSVLAKDNNLGKRGK